jgi:hypothetical protein
LAIADCRLPIELLLWPARLGMRRSDRRRTERGKCHAGFQG